MTGTVKVPGIGPVDKKYVYIAGAGVLGFVGYAYWNARKAAANEVPVSDYTTADALGDGSDYGDYSYDGGASDYVNPGGSQPPYSSDTNPNPQTNAEWATAAISRLSDLGYEATLVAAAIGKYMARLELTEAQADIVRQAVAILGPPPVGDFPIKVSPNGTTPPPSTGGSTGSKGENLPAPNGLSTWGNGPSRLTVPLKWNAVPGADYYRVYRSDVAYNVGSSEDTQITIGGLKPNTTYKFHVRAVGDDGKLGPKSATLTAKTKK